MKKLAIISMAAVAVLGTALYASETSEDIDLSKTPWLKGVSIGMRPTEITPVIPMKLMQPDGTPIPSEITEDEPILLHADTAIFDETPPSQDNGVEIPNPTWEEKASINWQLIDWEVNRNTTCPSNSEYPINQMLVVPSSPTARGAITCNVGRLMRYDDYESGRSRTTFANSSVAKDIKVKDITPPTCGLQIAVKEGSTGSVYPTENPPDHFPLPKPADINVTGSLFGCDPESVNVIPGFVLGPDMIVTQDQAAVNLSRDSVVVLSVIGDDNYKINPDKTQFGVCNGAGGEPTPVCEPNQEEYDFSNINIPENPHFYLTTTDMAGNRSVLFIPIVFK